MNKKVLSAILFSALFAGTGTFTSCIDNDEPAGIEELRGAKAELIRAKVSVEQANAALLLAQAEVEKAKAAKTNAEAEIEKAKAAKEQAEAELAEITNEEKRAELEMTIAENKQTMEQNALAHQAAMLELQQALATAQRSYELALAQIEIAKAVCSEEDFVTLGELKLAVIEAQGEVDEAAAEVASAEETYYNMTVANKHFGELVTECIEKRVADAEQDLKDAQDDLAKWESYVNEDSVAVNWMEEIAEMEDSVAAIEDLYYKKFTALALLKESEEYALLLKAEREAAEAYYDQEVDSVYSFEMLAEESYTETLALTEDGTVVTDAEVTEEEAKAAAAADAIAYLKDVDNEGEGYIADLEEKIASYTTEKKYWLDSIAAMAEKSDAALAEGIAKDLKAWKDALAAYKAAKTISTDAMVNDKGEGALKTYNDAIKAAAGDAAKIVVAKQNFADAIVAFFAGLPANQFTYNTITLFTGTNAAGKDTYATKNIKEWLTGNEKAIYFDLLVQYFDGNITKFWTEGTKETVKAGEAPSPKATGAVAAYIHKRDKDETADNLSLDKEKAATTLYGKLVQASKKAFGDAAIWADRIELPEGVDQDGYLHNEPSAEDAAFVYAKYGKTNMGTCGVALLAEDEETAFEAKNYEAIIENLEAAVAYWTAKWDILVANHAAAEEALETAEAAVEEYAKQWTDLEEEIEEIENRVARLTKMTNILKEAVMTYLPAEYTDEWEAYDVEGFAEFLKEQVESAKEDVVEAEWELAEAKRAAELALDGKYDPFAEAKKTLDDAVAALEKAQAELDEATANLAKGLEIIAAVNAAE